MISAVDNNIMWGMSGTTFGAYCQQWTTIRGATCVCGAVFLPKSVSKIPPEIIVEAKVKAGNWVAMSVLGITSTQPLLLIVTIYNKTQQNLKTRPSQ